METNRRKLKRKILELVQLDDSKKGMAEICRFPARQVINPLFLFLCSLDEKIKWHAVSAMGAVVSGLAHQDMESARVVMRRLMWNLNDESGGIGWGCPEAMGEIMACNLKIAEEYGCILISYIRSDGNFLENEILQRGVLWGIGRLAHARPKLLKGCAPCLHPYMHSDDATLRGTAVWAVGPLAEKNSIPILTGLLNDHSPLKLYREGRMTRCTISKLACEALSIDQAIQNNC